MRSIVLYYANCLDGFGAASYGEEMPDWKVSFKNRIAMAAEYY